MKSLWATRSGWPSCLAMRVQWTRELQTKLAEGVGTIAASRVIYIRINVVSEHLVEDLGLSEISSKDAFVLKKQDWCVVTSDGETRRPR